MFLGIAGLYDALPESMLTPPVAAAGLVLIGLMVVLVVRMSRRKPRWDASARQAAQWKGKENCQQQ